MQNFQQLAIIGPTASGKTSLAVKLAKKMNAHILSLDSLSIYKEINIVSAKPTIEEQDGIKHFGMDVLNPNETFDVTAFTKLYKDVYTVCLAEKKNLVIVGGTSFYLKMLIDGISELPSISTQTKELAYTHMKDLQNTYEWLVKLDNDYMSSIAPSDSYRIQKALYIYLETNIIPSEYFKQFPPLSTITEPLPIYQIVWDRDVLRQRIALRTALMLKEGLIEEVCMLEKKYGRKPNSMKSIGIIETLAYLDGRYDKNQFIEKIVINTARLAKRQTTFNNSQFKKITRGSIEELEKLLLL